MSTLVGHLRGAFRLAVAILLSPLRMVRSLRRSMTGASVTIMLVGIITLNIVWGYPWTGMFAAAISLMVVGWIVNRIMRPRLRVGFTLPQSSPAGESFLVTMHLSNRSRLPAMELDVQFDQPPAKRRARKKNAAASGVGFQSLSAIESVDVIHPSEHVDLSTTIRFDRRGVHALPNVIVTSGFPFHLFETSARLESDTLIAITPRPISGEEDSLSREMLTALGGWSHRLLAGDALDYTGSREYQSGMAVRRWDFTSWARLGRPIVREFQSPSIQAVTLIIDTSLASRQRSESAEDSIEFLLSLAATAIGQLARKMVCVRMYVTCEDPVIITGGESTIGIGSDSESLLIRLASAQVVEPGTSDESAAIVLDHISQTPVLVLTTRNEAAVWQQLPATVTVMRVDMPHASASTEGGRKTRRRRKHGRRAKEASLGGV